MLAVTVLQNVDVFGFVLVLRAMQQAACTFPKVSSQGRWEPSLGSLSSEGQDLSYAQTNADRAKNDDAPPPPRSDRDLLFRSVRF